MEISPVKPEFAAPQNTAAPCCTILYRWLLLIVTCLVMTPTFFLGQEQRPQIMPGERKPTTRKDKGPRAIAVLQLAANGKSSLVPIAIKVNGKFWDAAAYKADPVPMALDPGVVYEAEKTGNSQGLFTVGSALHSNSPNSLTPWIGTGKWAPGGSEEPSKPKSAESAPSGIGNVDGPPRLTRNPQAANAPPNSNPPSTTPAGNSTSGTSSSGNGGSGSGGTSSGDEPPRLKRPASEPKPSDTTPPLTNPADTKASDSKSADTKSAGAKADQSQASAPKTPESDSGAGEANRPRLRRGKPAESFADEDIPGYSKPGVKPAASTPAPAPAAATGPTQYLPAISDAAGRSSHSYIYQWLKDEESQRRQQMFDLAKQRLSAYLTAHAKATVAPEPASAKSTRHAAAKPVQPVIENQEMIAYDLWANNTPVILFAADAHLPSAAGSVTDQLQYSLLLVAYPDIYNNLHPLYVGITDKYHLDVTPRLELIDALDADGDGVGEILFREVSDSGSGWIIYRATADKLWKVYDSLNRE